MSAATLQVQKAIQTLSPQRPSFLRMGDTAKVRELNKEAKRVGYVVTGTSQFSFHCVDPENKHWVYRAVQVRPKQWAISYSTEYWVEPQPVLPATPLNLRKHLMNHPSAS